MLRQILNRAHDIVYTKNITYLIPLLFLAVVVPLLLMEFQILVINEIIPVEFSMQYLYLDYSNPNPMSMFFTNYVHDIYDVSHISVNIYYFVFLLITLSVIYYIIFPSINIKFHKYFIGCIFLQFFFILPFSISGIATLFGRLLGVHGGNGFSGILYAFFGLILFLILKIVTNIILLNNPEHDRRNFAAFSLIFISSITIIIPASTILLEIRDEKIGVFAHLGGFFLGIIMPSLTGLILEARPTAVKIFYLIIAGLTILITSVAWMVI